MNLSEQDVFTCKCGNRTLRSDPGQMLCRVCLSKEGPAAPKPIARTCDQVRIEVPPSVNGLFANADCGRVKTDKYKEWIERNSAPVSNVLRRFTCPVHISIVIWGGKGFPMSRDLDNCGKPVIDLLVSQGIIQGDSVQVVRSVTLEYKPESKPPSGAFCVVRVLELTV